MLSTPPPPPQNRRLNLADLFRRFVGFLNFADFFCRFVRFLEFCRFVLLFCGGFLPTKRLVCGPLGFVVPPLIKLFCGTSTLMLVRVQFVICMFALHAPVRSSAAVLQAPHHQPPNQWILGCRCLWLLWLCLVRPRLWPQSQWNLGVE